MRTIKFRAWDKKAKTMDDDFWATWEAPDLNEIFKVKDTIFLQYTGLKDKKGKEIYHFDLVSNGFFSAIIEWNESMGSWFAKLPKIKTDAFPKCWLPVEFESLEVIGNIYENKELLK